MSKISNHIFKIKLYQEMLGEKGILHINYPENFNYDKHYDKLFKSKEFIKRYKCREQ